MPYFVQTNQYKSHLFSNIAYMFTSNDNILSEYANYSQYLRQLFIFFCINIAVKASVINYNPFAGFFAPATARKL